MKLHKAKGKIPDCESCMPPLMEVNQDVWKIYSYVSGQLIVSAGGVVDINQLALWELLDRFKIENPISVFSRVVSLARHMITQRREKEKMKAKAEKMAAKAKPKPKPMRRR